MRTHRSVWLTFLALLIFGFSARSFGQVNVSISIAPPPLPVYDQPICPGDGYIWTPGYWAYDYDDADYYWVPGTWVMAPEVGYLWTPPWWGWEGGFYVFHEGWWGPHIGFYGGIYYGFGYTGVGYEGGYWNAGHFFYNRTVNNITNVHITNVYNRTVINNTNINRVSFNGGNGGITARPTPEEEAARNEHHLAPVAAQTQHIQVARENPELRASRNQGKPPIAATARPGEFSGHNVVAAREAGGAYHPPANRGGNAPREVGANGGHPAVHPNDLPAAERPAAPNTGDPKLDKKYQKQQDKLYAQQQKDREKLQAQQDKEHQKYTNLQQNDLRRQQMEQKHQQQTEQLQQRHQEQMQRMQIRQAPPPAGRPRR
jgi:hypothetical protein